MNGHPAAALKPRKKPTQQRSQHTWDVILDAAAQVFSQHGYQGTSTNRVAERAGVCIGTIYEYFPNKDVLLSELQSRWNDTCWNHLKQLPEVDPSLSFEDATRLMFQNWISVLRLNPALYGALVQELPTRANKWKADERLNKTIQTVIQGLEQYGNSIQTANLPMATELVVRGIQAYLDNLVVVDPNRLVADELIDELTYQFCEFFLKPAEAQSSG